MDKGLLRSWRVEIDERMEILTDLMDEWVDRWTSGWTDGWGKEEDGCVYEWIDRLMLILSAHTDSSIVH